MNRYILAGNDVDDEDESEAPAGDQPVIVAEMTCEIPTLTVGEAVMRMDLADVPILQGKDGWADLRAVRAGAVYATDGNQYFNRPGPRLVESLEILAETLHPEAFSFGHEGAGWQRL